jgi:protein-S-isoprenylcysteine O-methyltransferase Ste14
MVRDKIFRKWRITLSRLFAAALAVVILFSTSRWESIDLISTVLFLCGAMFVGVATVGRLWCSLYISGYKNTNLVAAGPYSVCRNPLYFFSLLGGIGVGLATETLIIPLLILTAFALYYPYVIRREQEKLAALHGEQYQQYCRSTPCFLPSLSLLNEPEEYSVRPKLFRKNLFDALCFIWFVGILELIEGLHESQLLPVLLRLY